MPEHLPHPEFLGPDPEPLGTERFRHAISGAECLAPAGVLALVPVRDTWDEALIASDRALAA